MVKDCRKNRRGCIKNPVNTEKRVKSVLLVDPKNVNVNLMVDVKNEPLYANQQLRKKQLRNVNRLFNTCNKLFHSLS